jgi:hypothetical protein
VDSRQHLIAVGAHFSVALLGEHVSWITCGAKIPGLERFRAKACPGLDPGWIPVRVKKTRPVRAQSTAARVSKPANTDRPLSPGWALPRSSYSDEVERTFLGQSWEITVCKKYLKAGLFNHGPKGFHG